MLLALFDAPVDDAKDLAPARELRREPQLAAGLGRRLEHHHLMAARRPRPVPPRGRPGPAPTTTTLRFVPLEAATTCGIVASRPVGGVVHAERLAAEIDAVDAVAHADAGPDLALAALRDLARDMRVGDVRAGHADHVELAGRDRVARGGDVLDARGVEHRELGRLADLAGEIEMRRRARAHAGDHVRERLVGVDVAADHVEEVDEAARDQPPGDRRRRPRRVRPFSQSSSQTMRTPTRKPPPTRAAHRLQHLAW